MASRDLTSAYIDRRTTALKRRNALGSSNGGGSSGKKRSNRLTAGGSRDDMGDHSLMLMEVGLNLIEFLLCFAYLLLCFCLKINSLNQFNIFLGTNRIANDQYNESMNGWIKHFQNKQTIIRNNYTQSIVKIGRRWKQRWNSNDNLQQTTKQ